MMAEPVSDGIVEHVSPVCFEDTLRRLTDAIAGAGLIVFDRFDHQAGAREAGFEMPPTTVLAYGHPKGGTPVMLAEPLAALDLPLRVLVRERSDGRAAIAFHPIVPMLRRAGLSEALATRLEPAQRLLLTALSA